MTPPPITLPRPKNRGAEGKNNESFLITYKNPGGGGLLKPSAGARMKMNEGPRNYELKKSDRSCEIKILNWRLIIACAKLHPFIFLIPAVCI